MKKIEFALESFKNIQDLIKFTDQKANAVLVISGLILTAFLHFSNDLVFVSFNKATIVEILSFLAGMLTIVGLVIVIYISIHNILKPRLAKNYEKKDLSLFYFEHINALGKKKIHTEYKELEEHKMLTLILDQQFEVSKILNLKIKALNKAFFILFVSVIILLIFIVLTRLN